MKRLFLLLVICFPLTIAAQHKLDSIPKDSVLKIWNHESEVYDVWERVDSVWMAKDYWVILKKFKLKMSCSGCEDILMQADLMVDDTGRLVEHRVVLSDKCGQAFDKNLENAFMEYFYSITFPAMLHKRVFRVLLGTGLKC